MIIPYRRVIETVACDRAGRGLSRLGKVYFWQDALSMLDSSSKVAIITGFMVPEVSCPETDGPSGSVVLGRALMRTGRECVLFTDPPCFSALCSCSESVEGPDVQQVEDSKGIISWGPDLVIFVERLGRASDGRYYNMRCKDISAYTYPLDDIFFAPECKQLPILAIGDGGNESGMGALSDGIRKCIPEFAHCASISSAKVALPVDVSNWGAYALACLLSMSCGSWLGHSLEEEEVMLRSLSDAGAVDGVTLKPDATVDGFSLREQEEILSALEKIYSDFMKDAGSGRS